MFAEISLALLLGSQNPSSLIRAIFEKVNAAPVEQAFAQIRDGFGAKAVRVDRYGVEASLANEYTYSPDPKIVVKVKLNLDWAKKEGDGIVSESDWITTLDYPEEKPPVKVTYSWRYREFWDVEGESPVLRRLELISERRHRDGIADSFSRALPNWPQSKLAAVADQIKKSAIPFTSELPSDGFSELEPLATLIDNAKVVGLGEASHGTPEHFRMKHKLVRFLVERMGFTVFAIEGNWPESEAANAYIQSGAGNAKDALRAMYFWTWQTEEIRDMLDWMKSYNADFNHTKKIIFSSYDMQTEEVAKAKVLAYLAAIAPDLHQRTKKLYEKKVDRNAAMSGQLPKKDWESVKKLALEARDLIRSNKKRLLSRGPKDAYLDAEHASTIYVQWTQMLVPNFFQSFGVRDRSMAENVLWLLNERYPGQKVMAWAHNGHVSFGDYLQGVPSMGHVLRRDLGQRYFVFGFASYAGEIRAIPMNAQGMQPGGPKPLTLPPPVPRSIEFVFHQVGPRLILPLREANGLLKEWSEQPWAHRGPGAAFNPLQQEDQISETPIREGFDALVFIDKSTAAKRL